MDIISIIVIVSLLLFGIWIEEKYFKLSYDDLRFIFSLTVGLGFITQLITIVILINRNKKKMKTTRL
ncbi:hypothetical protein B1no1_29000 [Thermolongibacillus altinsuensis]|nr:hypothetical protein B1no1_29000 [Thermolongibacillus altinsuensis]